MFCQNLLFGSYTGRSSPSLNSLPLPEKIKSTEVCGHSAPDVFSQVLIREEDLLPSTCWLHSRLYCPEGCCAPGPAIPFLQNYFLVSQTTACTGAWDFSSQKVGFGILLH